MDQPTPISSKSRQQSPAVQFSESVALMARLRAPGGCPWDREQTLATIRKYTLEEVYEVIDAIDREDWDNLREELGDLQLQILFYAQIAADEGQFAIADVLETLNRKLVRRHPHVFGEAAAAAGNNAFLQSPDAATPSEVLRNWDAIKRAEKSSSATASILESVPRSFPSKLGSKAAKVGFDWPDAHGILEKLREETAELQAEISPDDPARKDPKRVEEEFGDLLFTLANLARHLRVDPELALRSANAKFRRRFSAMETASSAPLDGLSAAELEGLWTAAKAAEKSSS
jgi:MazG family protein